MRRLAALPLVLAALVCARAAVSAPPRSPPPTRPPARLADTGLYADPASRTIADGVLPFSPQYPLWTDGAAKRRWIRLPPGAAIDASDARAWRFPVGTRLWKEFAFGRRVETRYMERTRAGWLYATYVWSEDGTDATLAPERGGRVAVPTAAGSHDVPSVSDCKACHQGARSEVLGFSLLQLSPDRDPLSPHASASPDDVDLAALAARGLVRGLSRGDLARPPRIVARTPRERAALGYLQGNCASCHNSKGPLASLGMSLEAPLGTDAVRGAQQTAVGVPSRYLPPDAQQAALRIVPGDPAASVLVRRMSSRHAAAQMPPLGTRAVDEEAVQLVSDWIRELPRSPGPALARSR
jgi:hypothetical protein